MKHIYSLLKLNTPHVMFIFVGGVFGFERLWFTEYTVCDPATYIAQLEQIREEGLAYSFRELDDYCMAISAPVYNQAGQVAYVLTVIGHLDRMQKQAPFMKEQILVAAKQAEILIAY